jgi:hypothetical protein
VVATPPSTRPPENQFAGAGRRLVDCACGKVGELRGAGGEVRGGGAGGRGGHAAGWGLAIPRRRVAAPALSTQGVGWADTGLPLYVVVEGPGKCAAGMVGAASGQFCHRS